MIKVTFFINRGEESQTYLEKSLLPLLKELPDVLRLEAAEIVASASGNINARMMVDVLFEDETRMNLAFASAEGRRISREIMNSAGAGLEMITAQPLV
ncbi:MAG: EthD family reductase [Bacteroidetes bacterium]|nr:EthD family reductase [Bacteroidota bacterium]